LTDERLPSVAYLPRHGARLTCLPLQTLVRDVFLLRIGDAVASPSPLAGNFWIEVRSRGSAPRRRYRWDLDRSWKYEFLVVDWMGF
jgi:hypothetical protein